MKFNERLLDLRKKKGWSQEELGYKLDVSRQTVSKWEAGQTTPELEKLRNLAKIFEITVDELINENDEKSEEKKIEDVENVSDETRSDGKKTKKKKSKIKFLFLYLLIVAIIFYIILVGYRFFIIKEIGDTFWEITMKANDYGYYMDKRTYGANYRVATPMTKEEHYYYINWFKEGTTEENKIGRVKIKKYEGDLAGGADLLNPTKIIYVDNIWITSDDRSRVTEFDEINKTYKKLENYNFVTDITVLMAEYENMFNTLEFYKNWSNCFRYAVDLRINISKTKDGDYYMSNEKLNAPKQIDNCYILINDERIIFEKIVYDQEMKSNYEGTRYKLRLGDVEEKDVEFPDFSEYTEI